MWAVGHSEYEGRTKAKGLQHPQKLGGASLADSLTLAPLGPGQTSEMKNIKIINPHCLNALGWWVCSVATNTSSVRKEEAWTYKDSTKESNGDTGVNEFAQSVSDHFKYLQIPL